MKSWRVMFEVIAALELEDGITFTLQRIEKMGKRRI